MKKTVPILSILFLLSSFHVLIAQTTYLPLNSQDEYLIDRLETKSGALSKHFFGFKATSRKDAMSFIDGQRMNIIQGDLNLTLRDRYNIQRVESINSDWVETSDGLDAAIPSKRPVLRYLYQYQPDAIHINDDDLFLVVNPVFYTEAFKEMGVSEMGYINTRGIEVRGKIKNKIGFYTMLADNQERPASYVNNFAHKFGGFPGMALAIENKPGNYDIFMGKGYVDAELIKDHLNVTFGYDNQFSGVGVRSLFLSDFAPPSTFLRFRGEWNRFSYQSQTMQLTADLNLTPDASDHRFAQKYAAIHQLGFQPTYWLQLGVFESTIFGSTNRLKATDLIPVIGYQSIAKAAGAHQNTSFGLYGKAVLIKKFQFYGQAYIDKFDFGQNDWWGNQVAFQLGGKYFDAFGLPDVDLHVEANMARPFTYGSEGQDMNYTHYNKPLAHPFGAGFAELIGQIRYQPANKLHLAAKAIYAVRGADSFSTGGITGVNPLLNQNLRRSDAGYDLTPGISRQSMYFNFNIAYEIRPNIFIEAGANYWEWKNVPGFNTSTNLYGGLRWNMSRKEYDSY